jgi:hypothetical protein
MPLALRRPMHRPPDRRTKHVELGLHKMPCYFYVSGSVALALFRQHRFPCVCALFLRDPLPLLLRLDFQTTQIVLCAAVRFFAEGLGMDLYSSANRPGQVCFYH